MIMAIRTLTLTIRNSITPIPIQIAKFSSTISNNSNPLSNLLQRYGFPPSDLHNFFAKNQFLLNSSVSDVERSLKILLSFCSSKNSTVSLVYNCPRLLELDFLKKWETGISQLGISENSNLTMIQNVLEFSRKLNLSPDDVSRCIECLRCLRFSSATITRVLEDIPKVITMNEEKIRVTIEFLLGIGIQRNKIDFIIRTFPHILGYDIKNKLNPLIDEFVSMGLSPSEIRQGIIKKPKILSFEIGELSKCLRMLKSLKCRVPIKEKIFSEGAFMASYKVKLRIDCLHKHGLIYRDAFGVLWREPRVILYEIDEIEKKIDFLINMMKFNVICLVDVPEYLGVNFEKQIVPRYNVIEHLRSRNGIGDEVGLRSLVKFSRMRFYNLYVKPYPECEKIYGRFEDVRVRNRHPLGIWKLFKPAKYPDSNEDLKNIKSFMEQLR